MSTSTYQILLVGQKVMGKDIPYRAFFENEKFYDVLMDEDYYFKINPKNGFVTIYDLILDRYAFFGKIIYMIDDCENIIVGSSKDSIIRIGKIDSGIVTSVENELKRIFSETGVDIPIDVDAYYINHSQ